MSSANSAGRESSARALLQLSVDTAYDRQPWPGYYERRLREFDALHEFASARGFRVDGARALDIGAGIGFGACLLACSFDRVVAVDLPRVDSGVHARGLMEARGYIAMVQARSVELVAADVIALPFADQSFDVVFSSFALQYASDRARAFREIFRVTCKGGAMQILVPTAAERAHVWLQHYPQLLRRAVARLAVRRQGTSASASSEPTSPKTRRARLAARLWPQPDYPYRSTIQQALHQRSSKWLELAHAAGFTRLETAPIGERIAGHPTGLILAGERA